MTTSRSLAAIAILTTLLLPLPARAQDAGPVFVPEQVFAGHSTGQGELRLGLGRKRPFTVTSLGTRRADGRLLLAQDIRFEGKPVQSRAWVMWQTAPGRYAATLTGAAGLAVSRTTGRRLSLRYPLTRWGLVMHQTLDLAPDGRTIANHGSIRFLGLPIGRLRETITLEHRTHGR